MNPETNTALLEQGTEAWLLARLGLATASEFKSILNYTKGGEPGSARRKYKAQLVVETLTGKQAERFKSGSMEWGTETEDLARLEYSMRTGNTVNKVGLIRHPFLLAGASPDGLVAGQPGGIEIKCFETANHIDALKAQQMPALHIPQVQGQMWIGELEWVDFVSFEPTLPENAQIFIQRIMRDDEYIKKLKLEVSMFMDEVAEDIAFIRAYGVAK